MDSDVITKLGPDDTGVYLVTTQGSQHIWNLDDMTYTRLPGLQSKSGSMEFDAIPVKLTRVERWPEVGSTSFIFYDDLYMPDTLEQWRQSSRIDRIEKIDNETQTSLLQS